VVVVGFSQGGALALLWALRVVDGSHDRATPDLAALAVVAGWLPSVDGLELDPAGCRAARVLIAHGDDDETVAPQLGRGAARLLERQHIDTTVTTLAAGHDLEPYVAAVREFLTPPR
jgi:predicted esterase